MPKKCNLGRYGVHQGGIVLDSVVSDLLGIEEFEAADWLANCSEEYLVSIGYAGRVKVPTLLNSFVWSSSPQGHKY